jgi:hypothetical protein
VSLYDGRRTQACRGECTGHACIHGLVFLLTYGHFRCRRYNYVQTILDCSDARATAFHTPSDIPSILRNAFNTLTRHYMVAIQFCKYHKRTHDLSNLISPLTKQYNSTPRSVLHLPDLLSPNRKRKTKNTIPTNSIHHAAQSSGLPILWIIYVHVLLARYLAEGWNPTDDSRHLADLSFSLCRKATPKTAEVEWRDQGSEELVWQTEYSRYIHMS